MPRGPEPRFLSLCQVSGVSTSICLMSPACSPAPLGKMIMLGGEILSPWAASLRHCLCHRQVSSARGGTSLAPSPELVPKPGMLWLTPKAVTDCGLVSAVRRMAGKQPVCFMSESHWLLQAFKAWCTACSASPLLPLVCLLLRAAARGEFSPSDWVWAQCGLHGSSPVPEGSRIMCVCTDLYLLKRHQSEISGWGTLNKWPREPWGVSKWLPALHTTIYNLLTGRTSLPGPLCL